MFLYTKYWLFKQCGYWSFWQLNFLQVDLLVSKTYGFYDGHNFYGKIIQNCLMKQAVNTIYNVSYLTTLSSITTYSTNRNLQATMNFLYQQNRCNELAGSDKESLLFSQDESHILRKECKKWATRVAREAKAIQEMENRISILKDLNNRSF